LPSTWPIFSALRVTQQNSIIVPAAGLRRKEIDLLEWPSFRFKDNAIRIEPTQFFQPESQDSIVEIQVDPQIMSIFRQYRAKAKATS
jgi:hypothetical protein